jgi:hypothetical protein
VGSTVTFWELPFEEYGSLAPEGWMKQTWQALSQTTLTLKGPNLGLPNERVADVSLMDAFVAQGYSAKTLTILNECRFWLAASHLSHITTACGKRIDKQCWEGKRHAVDMRPRLIHTYRPTTKDWEIWQEKIRETFLFAETTHLRLRQVLGPWIQRHHPLGDGGNTKHHRRSTNASMMAHGVNGQDSRDDPTMPSFAIRSQSIRNGYQTTYAAHLFTDRHNPRT